MSEIEQAIDFFQDGINEMEDVVGKLRPDHPDKLAIQALQEKAEREKQQAECGYCKDIPENTNIIEDDFNAIYVQENQLIATVSNSGSEYSADEFEADINYCPMCGRRLVEK